MVNTGEQNNLALTLSVTQKLRGPSDDTTIDYWHIERPIKKANKDNLPEDKERRGFLSHLDWIAQYLVSLPNGDVIAVAIDLKTETPTLYVSNNFCKIDKSKLIELGSSMQSLVVRSFKSYGEGKLQTDDQIGKESLKYLKPACEHAWNRFRSKLKWVQRSTENLSGTFNQVFVRIHGLWENKVADQNLVDPGGKLLTYAKMHCGETATVADAFIYRWSEINSLNFENVQHPERRAERLKRLIHLCARLVSSPIMVYLAEETKRANVGLDKEELAFLGQIYRRLKRIVKIQAAVHDFLKYGLKRFSDIWNNRINKRTENSFSLEIVYVFQSPLFNKLKSSKVFITDGSKIIGSIKDEALKDIEYKDPKIMEQLNSDLNGISSLNFRCETKFHCETTLALFLAMSKRSVEYSAIGVSKYMCWSCTQFFGKLNLLTGKTWFLSGSSGKSHHAWRFPTASLFTTDSGMEVFSRKFDEASQFVGSSAKTELKRVIRSYFPDKPPGPSGGPKPNPPNKPGPSSTIIPTVQPKAGSSDGRQTKPAGDTVKKGNAPSTKLTPAIQQKGLASGASSLSQGIQEPMRRAVDVGSDSSEGEISQSAMDYLIKQIDWEDEPKTTKR